MLGDVTDLRTGHAFRAARRRLGWTQRKLAEQVGLSQQLVSLIERGHSDRLSVRAVRRVAAPLEIDIDLVARWRGATIDRLIDSTHAALVDAVVGLLRGGGFEVVVEWSFNHYGERGAVDVIAWHAPTRTLVIVEVKSVIGAVHSTISTL